MGNKKAEREKKKARKRMNKIIIGIVSAVVLVAVVLTVEVGYKKNITGKSYANNDVNEIEGNIENEEGKNGEIKTGNNGISNENDLGIELSNYVVAGSEEARRSEEILKKAQKEREEKEKKEKEEIEKNKEESKSTKYAGKSTVQLASNAESTRDIRGAVKEIATTDISSGTLTLSQETYEYNGQRNTPDPTLKVGEDTLILGKDYEITYTNNINAGTGTATVTGKRGYTGTKTATFTINPKSITVKWKDEKDEYVYAYDGQKHMPEVETPIEGANGEKIHLEVVIKDDKQAIDAGTYTAVAKIKSIEQGTGPAKEPGEITVENKITTDSAGTEIAGNNVTKGTPLYIQITARQENGEIKSIYSDKESKAEKATTYTLPITENGTYGFAVVGSENTSIWYTVTVDNYAKVVPIEQIEIGDYVKYTPNTGESATWRVWEIDKGTGTVVIVPTAPLGSLQLSGSSDWLNAETKIENECDKYINTTLGVTTDNIKSMKIEDIEEVMPASETKKNANSTYGQDYTYNRGTFYAKKANGSEAKFDEYNTALDNGQTASSSNQVTLVETYWYKNSPTWNKLGNTKTGMTTDTYGTILGNTYGWLASRCVTCNSSYASFAVRRVHSGYVYNYTLCSSDGKTFSDSYGVRPLVTLSSKFFAGGGTGTSSSPWQLVK